MHDTTKVCLCCVKHILLYLVVPMMRASPLSAYVSLSSFLSLPFLPLSPFLFPRRARTIEYSVRLLRTQTSMFSSVSRSQLLMYKMKQCYKPNKNVLPFDSPTVNI